MEFVVLLLVGNNRYGFNFDDSEIFQMRYLVTGCAGFIGSHLTDRLIALGHEVIGMDNFSTGYKEFLAKVSNSSMFKLVEGDLLDQTILNKVMQGCEAVFHFAANADVRFGVDHPDRDLKQNTIVTFNVLEAMRANGVRRIAFASTGSIYGEATITPTPENAPFPLQTSLYGASKLAAEGLIQAYCEGFGFQSHIFRFVSILGERYTHGHVFDFYKRLLIDSENLTILGNGKQKKSYLYVQDCIDAILLALEKAKAKINVFNLGTDEHVQVDDSVGWMSEHLSIHPKLTYSGGERGWIGDNPFIFLDCSKIRSLGWKPEVAIKEGIIKTLIYLQHNPWVLESRP